MLNAGHRQGATAGRCVIRGKSIETEELPAYCAVALAGLNDLPDTIMTRSVVVRMRRRKPDEKVSPWRSRINGPEGDVLGGWLRDWTAANADRVRLPAPEDFPEGVEDRNADVWEPLLAIADLAGPRWLDRARVAAATLVTESADRDTSLGQMLLRDLRVVFQGHDRLTTNQILNALHEMDESPWAELRGKPLDSRGLARRLKPYEVKSGTHRFADGSVQRGYLASDLADPWDRYLPSSEKCVTSVTSATSEPGTLNGNPSDVTHVTHVTHSQGHGRAS